MWIEAGRTKGLRGGSACQPTAKRSEATQSHFGPQGVQRQRIACPPGAGLEIHRLMARDPRPRRAHGQDEQVGPGLFLDRRPRRRSLQRLPRPSGQEGRGPAYDYLPPPLPQQPRRSWPWECAPGRHSPDGHDCDRHALDGRNFVGHFSRRDWNVLPVTSVIEVQYVMAPGTALVQKRYGGDGVSIVTGGRGGHGRGRFRLLHGLVHRGRATNCRCSSL